MSRVWLGHRQAYWPRMWPWLLGASVVMVPCSVLLTHWVGGAVYWHALLGLVIGLTAGKLRLHRWKRKHPAITAEQWLDRRRKAAPWN